MVRINFIDGSTQSAILRPASPSFTVPSLGTKGEIAWVYLRLGVEHILQGIDHLLFVLGLLLLERSFRILEIRWPRWTEAHLAYTVSSLGAFWSIQRVAIMVYTTCTATSGSGVRILIPLTILPNPLVFCSFWTFPPRAACPIFIL